MASYIERRKFLVTLLGGGAAAAWPLAARAQQATRPMVGYLGLYSPSSEVKRISSFREGLKEAGFDEGSGL
jgi:putative tryptophan/tyrosine transport system substrate-binding protein